MVRTEDPTTLALAELGDGGSVSRYRFYTQGTSAAGLTSEAALVALPERVATLFVGTLGLVLEPMASALEAVVDRLAGSDTMVVVDPNCRPHVIDDASAYRRRCGGSSRTPTWSRSPRRTSRSSIPTATR